MVDALQSEQTTYSRSVPREKLEHLMGSESGVPAVWRWMHLNDCALAEKIKSHYSAGPPELSKEALIIADQVISNGGVSKKGSFEVVGMDKRTDKMVVIENGERKLWPLMRDTPDQIRMMVEEEVFMSEPAPAISPIKFLRLYIENLIKELQLPTYKHLALLCPSKRIRAQLLNPESPADFQEAYDEIKGPLCYYILEKRTKSVPQAFLSAVRFVSKHMYTEAVDRVAKQTRDVTLNTGAHSVIKVWSATEIMLLISKWESYATETEEEAVQSMIEDRVVCQWGDDVGNLMKKMPIQEVIYRVQRIDRLKEQLYAGSPIHQAARRGVVINLKEMIGGFRLTQSTSILSFRESYSNDGISDLFVDRLCKISKVQYHGMFAHQSIRMVAQPFSTAARMTVADNNAKKYILFVDRVINALDTDDRDAFAAYFNLDMENLPWSIEFPLSISLHSVKTNEQMDRAALNIDLAFVTESRFTVENKPTITLLASSPSRNSELEVNDDDIRRMRSIIDKYPEYIKSFRSKFTAMCEPIDKKIDALLLDQTDIITKRASDIDNITELDELKARSYDLNNAVNEFKAKNAILTEAVRAKRVFMMNRADILSLVATRYRTILLGVNVYKENIPKVVQDYYSRTSVLHDQTHIVALPIHVSEKITAVVELIGVVSALDVNVTDDVDIVNEHKKAKSLGLSYLNRIRIAYEEIENMITDQWPKTQPNYNKEPIVLADEHLVNNAKLYLQSRANLEEAMERLTANFNGFKAANFQLTETFSEYQSRTKLDARTKIYNDLVSEYDTIVAAAQTLLGEFNQVSTRVNARKTLLENHNALLIRIKAWIDESESADFPQTQLSVQYTPPINTSLSNWDSLGFLGTLKSLKESGWMSMTMMIAMSVAASVYTTDWAPVATTLMSLLLFFVDKPRVEFIISAAALIAPVMFDWFNTDGAFNGSRSYLAITYLPQTANMLSSFASMKKMKTSTHKRMRTLVTGVGEASDQSERSARMFSGAAMAAMGASAYMNTTLSNYVLWGSTGAAAALMAVRVDNLWAMIALVPPILSVVVPQNPDTIYSWINSIFRTAFMSEKAKLARTGTEIGLLIFNFAVLISWYVKHGGKHPKVTKLIDFISSAVAFVPAGKAIYNEFTENLSRTITPMFADEANFARVKLFDFSTPAEMMEKIVENKTAREIAEIVLEREFNITHQPDIQLVQDSIRRLVPEYFTDTIYTMTYLDAFKRLKLRKSARGIASMWNALVSLVVNPFHQDSDPSEDAAVLSQLSLFSRTHK